MKKKIKEEVFSETIGERYNKFLISRKGNGGKYVKEIIEFLADNLDKVPEGWVRARELKTNATCSDQTLFRLLTCLKSERIIERLGKDRTQHERPGQDPVYYRINPLAGISTVLTEAGRKMKISQLSEENMDLTFDLFDAKSVLKRHGLLPEYEQEREITKNTGKEFENWSERKLREHQIKLTSSLQQTQ